ncbi:BON1-associated protein 2-like [Nicotiana tabacum]|uniref:BON1-associated protein 2-like n=1 Tax=Nicotiana tabacum TaxID=4097 RepID=A0A1S4APP9_TOBAC|nr:BON1-associated protein 2-like [Nicotiana tomentosiformis]XP_016478463.1 PREDICTED: BON1-associated protein 2-like [Nicotiana tabacum]
MKPLSRALEITVISGENLRESRTQWVKKNVFVNIKTESSSNIQTTRMDKEGGSFPVWNEKLIVDMPMHARYLTVEVQCKTSSGIKTIGIARVPTSDFIGGYLPENYLHLLSYRLRDEKGEKNGIINFSVKVKNVQPYSSTGCATAYSQQWTAAPVAMGSNASGGVVTGIPVYPSSYN